MQPGENVFSLARFYGVSAGEIAAANDIDTNGLIFAGETLLIPLPAGSRAPVQPNFAVNSVRHIIRPGETLNSIAELYEASADRIAEQNGLRDRDLIFAGFALSVPLPPGTVVTDLPGTTMHRIRPGEILNGIAAFYDVQASELAQLNGLSNPNLIFAGNDLAIPQPWSRLRSADGTVVANGAYLIQPGDTLFGIALQLGVSMFDLARLNDMEVDDIIFAGQTLVVPLVSGDNFGNSR